MHTQCVIKHTERDNMSVYKRILDRICKNRKNFLGKKRLSKDLKDKPVIYMETRGKWVHGRGNLCENPIKEKA